MKRITYLLYAFLLAAIVFASCTESDDTDTNNEDLATLSAVTVTAINPTSAVASASVNADGGSTILARGFVYDTSSSPTLTDNKTTETGELGAFSSPLSGLAANTIYYIRAYATNENGTAYSAESTFTTSTVATGLATVTTAAISGVTATSATSGGNVLIDGGSAITARGIAYSTTQSPTIAGTHITATGTTGAFVSPITGLTASTTYYVRAYATNANGAAYGNEQSFTTSAAATNGPTGGNAVCNGSQPTAVVPVTSSTGKIWMDRNLGASRAGTSSKDFQAYGCLYQWGRGNDGHASITWTMGEPDGWGGQPGTAVNGSTYTLSSSDTPPNALFIKDETSIPYDWRSPKNDNLWQGANGINNPCPAGYRVPTRAEYQAEIAAYAITNPTAAYNSVHKFVMAGDRAFDSGSVRGAGEGIFLWTSTVDGNDSHRIIIQPGNPVYTNSVGRAGGYSVRCIKN